MPSAEVFRRTDGRWAWRLKADNGYIVATDGGQGYENATDAEAMCRRVISGEYGSGTTPVRV